MTPSKSRFYEFITIIRQDVSLPDIDKIAEELKQIIDNYKGSVIKTEYWGLRSLAYEIKNNKKGHYYFMGIEATKELLDEVDRRTKINESIIRTGVMNVKEISKDPSAILRAKNSADEETIDVTSSGRN